MGCRSSSDRDLTQEDVEEENYTKIKSTPTTNYNIDDLKYVDAVKDHTLTCSCLSASTIQIA
jgi:hypothetical protein